MVQLHRWGLLDRVAASNCTPIHTVVSDHGDFPLAMPAESGDGVDIHYAPRRIVLDKILVDAAVAAGAELRERFTVTDLVWEDDRVVGIRGRVDGGAEVTERARIVIGADGAHSAVAKAVNAPRYHERPAYTFAYYSYFSGVPMRGIEVWIRPPRAFINFPTNDGLTCVAIQAPVAGFHAFRADIEGNFFAVLDQVPAFAARVRAGRRAERWYGTADTANFFRKPFGPGWALVGDAGYHKDPILALGISDAFRDAELLTDAIDAGSSGREPLADALAAYQRQRDVQAGPSFGSTVQFAQLAPPPPEMQQLFGALRGNQEQTNRFFGTFAGTVPIPEFFAPENLGQIFASAQQGAVA
jgi:2-polyprenyl-6-methoxyphenol hydroxylase-like FAD-dependent oxidoreductase